jgi:long-chain acyl-CoA synthetase
MIRTADELQKSKKLNAIPVPDSVRLLISTAMPLTEEIFANFAKRFGRYLNQAYGIIECGLPFVNYRANEKNGTSVGRHLPKYEVRLALQDENDTAGEILLKGDGFFDAYFNPWQTQDQILSSGGWFHTGDLGRFAPGGYLNIVGRKKSAINFLGLKIFPEKIEDIINSHPSVEESRVVGKKHPDFGEIPAAEIIPAEDKEIDEIELTKHCAAHLAKHEIPQVFEPVTEIPKTRSGKVSRR